MEGLWRRSGMLLITKARLPFTIASTPRVAFARCALVGENRARLLDTENRQRVPLAIARDPSDGLAL